MPIGLSTGGSFENKTDLMYRTAYMKRPSSVPSDGDVERELGMEILQQDLDTRERAMDEVTPKERQQRIDDENSANFNRLEQDVSMKEDRDWVHDTFQKRLEPGDFALPYKLYEEYRRRGLSPEEARRRFYESVSSPEGTHPGISEEDFNDLLRRIPQSEDDTIPVNARYAEGTNTIVPFDEGPKRMRNFPGMPDLGEGFPESGTTAMWGPYNNSLNQRITQGQAILNEMLGMTMATSKTPNVKPKDQMTSEDWGDWRQSVKNVIDDPKRDYTWVELSLLSAWRGVSAPSDVLKGKLNPRSEEAVERAFEFATTVVMAPAPIAHKFADGTLGAMAGISSKTANRASWREALRMNKHGIDADTIWKRTGWFLDQSDLMWKFEIPSTKASVVLGEELETLLKTKGEDHGGNKFWAVTLPEILDFPELYTAYPQLKNTKVVLTDGLNSLGSAEGFGMDMIWLNPNKIQAMRNPREARETVLHEVQHLIQNEEGFSKGTNPTLVSQVVDQVLDVTERAAWNDPDILKQVEAAREILKDPKQREALANTLYRSKPGEREASMVSDVRDVMSSKDLVATSPAKTTENMIKQGWFKDVDDDTASIANFILNRQDEWMIKKLPDDVIDAEFTVLDDAVPNGWGSIASHPDRDKLKNQIIELNNQGMREIDISKALGLPRDVVHSIRKKEGLTDPSLRPYTNTGYYTSKKGGPDVNDILMLNRQGKTAREISEELGVDYQRVTGVLRANDIVTRKRMTPQNREDIITAWKAGRSTTEIAHMAGVSPTSVANTVKGIPRGKPVDTITETIKQTLEEKLPPTPMSVQKTAPIKVSDRTPRGVKPVFTDDLMDEVEAMSRKNVPIQKIADDLDLDIRDVQQIRKDRGILGRFKQEKVVSEGETAWKAKIEANKDIIPRVIELRKQGKSFGEIAKELKITRGRVAGILDRAQP